jgi:hypothetical protein
MVCKSVDDGLDSRAEVVLADRLDHAVFPERARE